MKQEDEKRFKIVHIITSLHTGGAETMLCRLLCGMDRDRFLPSVISLLKGGSLRRQIEELNIPVYSLDMKQGIPNPTLIFRLRRLINRLKPDLVQGWMYHGNLVASLANLLSSKENIKLLWNVRQYRKDFTGVKIITELVIRLGVQFSNYPEKVVYNSQSSKIGHISLGYQAENSIVIQNGFDTEVFLPDAEARKSVRLELGLPEDAILVGMIARYHPMKDHANFLNAAGKIVKKRDDIYYLLAGRDVDSENKELRRLIDVNGLKNNVFLIGDRRDTPRITASLSIAVLSSWTESFPNVVGEAMSCAVPCVVTDVGDISLLVGDTGMIVPPRNPERLAHAIEELVTMGPEELNRLGKRSRDKIIKEFSLGKMVKKYQKLYSDILS